MNIKQKLKFQQERKEDIALIMAQRGCTRDEAMQIWSQENIKREKVTGIERIKAPSPIERIKAN